MTPRLITLFALATFATPALADCDDFDLVSDGSHRSDVFVGGDTVDIGDRRVGKRAVTLNGNAAGTHHWVGTLYDATDGAGLSDQTGAFRLTDGDIHYRALWDRTRSALDTDQPGGTGYTAAIIGGTGKYDEAAGTITTTFDGITARYSFDID